MRKSKVWQVIPAKPILSGKILCSISHKGFLPPCARSTCRKVSLAQGGCSGCRRSPCAWSCFHKVTFRSAAVFENFCCSQKYWDGKHHTSVVLFPSMVTLGIYCPERGELMSLGLGLKDPMLGQRVLPQGLSHSEFIVAQAWGEHVAQGVLPGTLCGGLHTWVSGTTTSLSGVQFTSLPWGSGIFLEALGYQRLPYGLGRSDWVISETRALVWQLLDKSRDGRWRASPTPPRHQISRRLG